MNLVLFGGGGGGEWGVGSGEWGVGRYSEDLLESVCLILTVFSRRILMEFLY
jgi:hypothetical protein